MSKPLPKSLHTITAIVAVARHVQSTRTGLSSVSNPDAIRAAVTILGYTLNDPSNMIAKSLKTMDTEDARRVVKAVA